MDNEDSEYRHRRQRGHLHLPGGRSAELLVRLVSQGLPACKSANRNARPEGEAPSRHRRGARVRGSEAQPLTALSGCRVWTSRLGQSRKAVIC